MVEPVSLDERTIHEFARYMKRFPELYEHLVEIVKRHVSDCHPLILDLGAGPGLLSVKLLEQIPEATVVGIDPLLQMLRLAKENVLPSYAHAFEALQGGSEKIPLKDDIVDGIVSRFSLPYWSQPQESFKEMHRVLKPGGIVVLEELNKKFPRWKLSLLGLWMRARGAGKKVADYHAKAYPHAHTMIEVRQLFTDTGFSVLETEGKEKEWRFIVVARKP
jgi:ubiquinone/menaquinone biosynthesis C-methylase UbiE